MANINIRLNKNFTTQFNKMNEKYGEEFAQLQGLSDAQMSYTDFISNFIDKDTIADASIDGNANVSRKDIVTLLSEMAKPHRKLLAFNKIYYELNKAYGFKEANQIMEDMWNYSVYLHDFDTSTFVPYCFAYDLKPIAEKGLFFIDGYNAVAPKHLDSFIQILMEAVAFLTRRASGACGLPNLIPYLYYFWSRDVRDGYYTKSPEIYRDQQIQALIYRLNQPWVRQDQCAFTNVSIFDHPYFEAIFGGSVFPDGTPMIDEEEEILEFQKAFINVVNEVREDNVFTFPVLTASLLYQNEKFVDEEYARWACEASRKWNLFNFFTDSSVNSLSNCCRLKSDITDLYFNSIGGTALEVGSVKVSTLNLARVAYRSKDEKEFLINLKELLERNLKLLHIIRHIIKRNVEKGLLPNFTYNLINFEHLYNTVGVNGVSEAIKNFGLVEVDELGNTYYTDDAYEFGKRIFKVIHNTIDNFCLDKDYKVNVEQAPKSSVGA